MNKKPYCFPTVKCSFTIMAVFNFGIWFHSCGFFQLYARGGEGLPPAVVLVGACCTFLGNSMSYSDRNHIRQIWLSFAIISVWFGASAICSILVVLYNCAPQICSEFVMVSSVLFLLLSMWFNTSKLRVLWVFSVCALCSSSWWAGDWGLPRAPPHCRGSPQP